MEDIKLCFNYLKNQFKTNEMKLAPTTDYTLIERKRKLHYFSKFSLDLHELEQIYNTITQIKRNLLQKTINSIKICSLNYLNFNNNETDNEKSMIIFMNCFIHFYSNCGFLFSNKLNIEDLIDDNLIFQFTKYQIIITNSNQFKIFCYKFFLEAEKEFSTDSFTYLQSISNYFNPDIIEEQKLSRFANFKENNNIKNLMKSMQKRYLVPLISATERVVDMVLSFDNIPIESKLHQDFKFNDQVSTGSNSSSDTPIRSEKLYKIKRILCELTKSEATNKELELMEKSAYQLYKITENIINKSPEKFYFIQDYLCYIVEINNELLKNLPDFEHNHDDCNIRFIVLGKNIYNLAIETYFALYDLYNIDLKTFVTIFKKRCKVKVSDKLIHSVLHLFKCLNEEFLKNSNNNITDLLKNLIEVLNYGWEQAVVEKGKELTSFSKI